MAISTESSSVAIELQELAVHYQAQIAFADGRLAGFEALLRWQDPDGELALPAEFLNDLTHAGMLRAATRQVLHEVVDQIEDWRPWLPDGARLALNVPAAILTDRELLHDLRRLGRERPEVADHLMLEVSERTPHEELAAACAEYRHRCGDQIHLALDDVGTTPRSAQLLRTLPVDAAKLDISVIADLPASRRTAAVARSVVAVARKQGVRVIAVGVEREDQQAFLQDCGCDIAQGFIHGQAEAPRRAARWLPARGDRA